MTGGVESCRTCNFSDLEFHDLYYDTNFIDLGKRLDAIAAPYKKSYPSSVWGLLLVAAVASCTALFHQYAYNPDGYVTRQAATITAPLRTAQSPGQKAL